MLPDFKTLLVGVRPARVAILLNGNDQDWQDSCIRILEWATSVWGGKHCAIAPTDGKGINELIWQELEAFDPDYVFVYQKTLADIKFSNAERYNSILEEQLKRFLSESRKQQRSWEQRSHPVIPQGWVNDGRV